MGKRSGFYACQQDSEVTGSEDLAFAKITFAPILFVLYLTASPVGGIQEED